MYDVGCVRIRLNHVAVLYIDDHAWLIHTGDHTYFRGDFAWLIRMRVHYQLGYIVLRIPESLLVRYLFVVIQLEF